MLTVTFRLLSRKILIAVLFVLFGNACLLAQVQESRVYAISDPSNAGEQARILLKWYSPDFLYPEGVNIYRRQVNTLQWARVNETPVVQKDSIDAAYRANDEDLQFFQDAVLQLGDSLQDNFVFVNVLIKSFSSKILADFLGIYYEDTGARAGVTYEYRVNKISNGTEVLIAVSKPVTAGQFVPDEPVKELEIFQNGPTVDVNWLPEEYRFYAVNIYRNDPDSVGEVRLNKKPMLVSMIDSLGVLKYPNPFFREDSLREGFTYAYQLAGVGFFGEETRRTEPVEVTIQDITAPEAPEELEVDSDSMKVYLDWQNVEDEEIQGIHIYRSRKSDGPYERVNDNSLTPITTSFVDLVPAPGPYYYYVASHDEFGNEGNSRLVFEEVADVQPPAVPQNLVIESDTALLKLSWVANTEPDLQGYMIYRTVGANKDGNFVLLNADPIKENQFEQPLPRNVKSTFYYKILAIDTSYNKSDYTNVVSGFIPDVVAPERPVIKYLSYEEDNIKIHWVPNVDLDLMGYHVYRNDTAESEEFNRLNVNVLEGYVEAYTDRNARPNTTYQYYIEAVDSVGNRSQPSELAHGYLLAKSRPIEINNVRIRYHKRKKTNTLEWALAETVQVYGFVVFRGTSLETLKPITGMTKSKIYVDKNVRPDDEYFYQVRVYDDLGQDSASEVIKWSRK